MKRMDEFEVDMTETAITFAQDGKVTLYLPKYEEDIIIDPNTHAHVYTAIAIMMSLEDQRFHDLIAEKVNTIMASASMASNDGCGSGCGGCHGCDKEDESEDN